MGHRPMSSGPLRGPTVEHPPKAQRTLPLMLEQLARWCFHRRRLVLVTWILAFVAFGAFGSAFNGGYSQSTDLPGSDAVAAFNLLKDRFPQQSGDSVLVAFKADAGIDDPAVRPRLE